MENPGHYYWARNNHMIVSRDYFYIRYEDGSEELYNLKKDPNEWYNVANEKKYAPIKSELARFLPTKE